MVLTEILVKYTRLEKHPHFNICTQARLVIKIIRLDFTILHCTQHGYGHIQKGIYVVLYATILP